MKKNTKFLTVSDFTIQIYNKKKFILSFFIIGIIFVNILNFYKLNGPKVLNMDFKEKYFPISNEFKQIIRNEIVSVFRENQKIAELTEDKILKSNILNKNLNFNLKLEVKNFGSSIADIFYLEISYVNSNTKNLEEFPNKIREMFKVLETVIRKDLTYQIEQNISFYEETYLSSIYENETDRNLVKVMELRRNVKFLKDPKSIFLNVHPSNPSFATKRIDTKTFIILPLLFLSAGVLIVILNRFFSVK